MLQQKADQRLNPWLITYIEQHRRFQSRPEIDHDLLKAAYTSQEIEAAWQAFAPRLIACNLPLPMRPSGPARYHSLISYQSFFLLAGISSLISLLLTLFLASYQNLNNLEQEAASFYHLLMCLALGAMVGLNLSSFYLLRQKQRLDKFRLGFFYGWFLAFVLMGSMTNYWNGPAGVINWLELCLNPNLLTASLLASLVFSFIALYKGS